MKRIMNDTGAIHIMLLDALMNRVFSIEQAEEVRCLHRLRIRGDLPMLLATRLS